MTRTGIRQRRILLVEDDGDLRDALSDALRDRGHDVVAVNNGREALQRMRLHPPDVVVLDLMMPVMDGWQFRVEQKNDPALAETPVVAISASHSQSAAAVDADLFLRKPVDTATLLQGIETVIGVHERKLEPSRTAEVERMAALGTLAAGVAHEINNPLTYVLLHLAHALRVLPGLATEQNRTQIETLEQLLQGALEGSERIRGITGSIRSFSRGDDLARTPIDVHPALEAALRFTDHELRHRATLRKDLHEAPLVLANESMLGQVLLNIITNAFQCFDGSDASRNEIRVTTGTDPKGWAFVAIADTGPGIPATALGRVFEPFFTTKPQGKGTGLGLSISRGIIAALGGNIEVSTAEGCGTTFRIELPPADIQSEVRWPGGQPP